MKLKMDQLPEDCIAHVLSFLSPPDVCRSSVLSPAVRDAAESELLWDKVLPPDHQEIISRLVSPITFKSKKELFFKLSNSLLIDEGRKAFSIDKATGKKCYILSARELYIAWSANPFYWCWKPLPGSRFHEAVELIMTSWLEIQGKINTRILSPDTHYGAYLIFQIAHSRAYGLDTLPTEVSIVVGTIRSQRTISLSQDRCGEHIFKSSCHTDNVVEGLRTRVQGSTRSSRAIRERKDGWLEIELGEFFNDGINDKEVKMSLKEVNGVHLKGGLVLEGIEVRPI